ncbi:ABC transporter permease [Candidatus Formimonas warabiya]|uniref:Branched-chain amino acid ABC transporter permease n=1 Tax=Formimonas warabiya TaxID=1761012 RepID=A0A3G1KQJ2_FORW1|nr:ABC transporter permease [Candidatus Formimonas warabiya]ATW24739.1 hypothetical protein DCMF_08090 [Candidatus Formimonas warabiya]
MFVTLGQLIVSGLASGSLYALVALGIVIVYKASNRVNFAYGQMAMLSTFFAYSLLTRFKLPYAAAFLGALVFSALLGVIVRNIVRPVKSESGFIMATLAIYMIITALAGWIWGWDAFPFPDMLSGEPLSVLGVVISQNNLLIFIITITLMMLMYLFFKYTMTGIAMRAVSQNPVASRLMGISVDKVFTITWIISGVLGGIAGLLVAPTTFLEPNMMAIFLFKAFTAAVLGGFTSYPGVVIGGLSLGVLENLVGGYLSNELKSTFAFILLVVVLCIRPEGLLGNRVRMLGKSSVPEGTVESNGNRAGWTTLQKLVVLGLALILPFLFRQNSYVLYFANLIGIYMILAVGLDIIVGYLGQFSLGHASFLAIGAYTSALLMLKWGIPFWLAMPAAGFITCLVGFFLGLSAIRLSGLYLAIATFGFGAAVPQILLKWDGLTNGAMGLKPPHPTIGLFAFDNEFKFYFLVLVVLIITIMVTSNILHSKTGRAIIALRDSEAGAEAMGIRLSKYRVMAFVISAFFAGIAGSLYAHMVGFISPSDFNDWTSLIFLCMLLLGGAGNIAGVLAGVIFMTAVPLIVSDNKSLTMLLFGTALLFVTLFFPGGLASIYDQVGNILHKIKIKRSKVTF